MDNALNKAMNVLPLNATRADIRVRVKFKTIYLKKKTHPYGRRVRLGFSYASYDTKIHFKMLF